MKHYDIAIIGDGLVAKALALALKPTSLKIAFISNRLSQAKDPRLFALNNLSCQFLKSLQLWPKLTLYAAPITQVHVSQQGCFGAMRLSHRDINLPQLGFMIPACRIETALNDAMQDQTNFSIYSSSVFESFQSIDTMPDRLILNIKSNHFSKSNDFSKSDHLSESDDFSTNSDYSSSQLNNLASLDHSSKSDDSSYANIALTATLVIGADGARSTVRQALNISADVSDYHQSAIVTRTRLSRPHRHITYQRFIADGTIAMLPLQETSDNTSECATIWSASMQTAQRLMSLSSASFTTELQQQFGMRLGRLQSVAERHVFPLQMVRAHQTVAPHAILIGNAAHTLHPITAQGFNIALFEVAALAETLLASSETSHQVPYQLSALQLIDAKLRSMQQFRLRFADWAPRSLTHSSHMMHFTFPLGVIGFDLLPGLKKKLINLLSGQGQYIPRSMHI